MRKKNEWREKAVKVEQNKLLELERTEEKERGERCRRGRCNLSVSEG